MILADAGWYILDLSFGEGMEQVAEFRFDIKVG